jgi:DNA topoisomerase-1
VDADLRRHGLPREKVVAAVVALLDETSLRVGNERYARDNRSYGLTTLRSRHATAGRGRVRLRFKGKSAQVDVGLQDRRLASVVSRRQDLPGQRLFSTRTRDRRLAAGHVRRRQRLHPCGDRRRVLGQGSPDLVGTLAAFEALARRAPAGSAGRRPRGGGGRRGAEQLGNTRAVARQAYVHPRSTGRSRRAAPAGHVLDPVAVATPGETELLRLLA